MEETYYISPEADVTTAQWRSVVQTPKTARYSLDGTLVLVSWQGATPEAFIGVSPTFDKAGIQVKMQEVEWLDETVA